MNKDDVNVLDTKKHTNALYILKKKKNLTYDCIIVKQSQCHIQTY